MQQTRIMMGMPITVEIVDSQVTEDAFKKVFDYFNYVDEKFSTYKVTSEISKINRGELQPEDYSDDMKAIFLLSDETKKLTDGYFDIQTPDGGYDPSGLVKGWSILNAGNILRKEGFSNFYIDAGGDIEASGKNSKGEKWSVGIRNPFSKDPKEAIVKVVAIQDKGIATSGTYIRGQHIYNPLDVARGKPHTAITDIVSLTVIGPNVYEADRFATAAFAMGKEGIGFIQRLNGYDGYMIDKDGIATMTSDFEQYIHA